MSKLLTLASGRRAKWIVLALWIGSAVLLWRLWSWNYA